MPKVPELQFSDIIIAEKYTGGHDYERCKNGLWSIYNVIKKIISSYPNDLPLHFTYREQGATCAKLLECLYMIGANAKFEDQHMGSIVYSGKTNKKYKRGMPAAKYLFQLEKHGFAFRDLLTPKEDVPKNKLSIKDIQQFTLTYDANDFSDVIFGLKLFSDICMGQTGDCFYPGDIRVAFEGAPKLYAPPADEVFYALPENEQRVAYAIHNELEVLGCVGNLERDYMMRYYHPKMKNNAFATIYVETQFGIEIVEENAFAVKLNLRNIGNYIECLSECTDSIQQSILKATDCGGCKQTCNGAQGVRFAYGGMNYNKCPWYAFRFNDFSEQAISNYVQLIKLEDAEIRGGRNK